MIYWVIALTIFLTDSAIKGNIEKKKKLDEETAYCKGSIIITKYYNKGAMLNMMQNHKKILLTFTATLYSILLAVFLPITAKKGEIGLKLAFSSLLGGATSNLWDRITKGYVVDYINFPKIKRFKRIIFNTSDFFIFIGAFLAAVFWYKRDNKVK